MNTGTSNENSESLSSPTVAVTKKKPEVFTGEPSLSTDQTAFLNVILPFSSISNLSQFLPFLMLQRTLFPVISVLGALIVNLFKIVLALAALSTVILN